MPYCVNSSFVRSSLNLWLGSCFTYQDEEVKQYVSQVRMATKSIAIAVNYR